MQRNNTFHFVVSYSRFFSSCDNCVACLAKVLRDRRVPSPELLHRSSCTNNFGFTFIRFLGVYLCIFIPSAYTNIYMHNMAHSSLTWFVLILLPHAQYLCCGSCAMRCDSGALAAAPEHCWGARRYTQIKTMQNIRIWKMYYVFVLCALAVSTFCS